MLTRPLLTNLFGLVCVAGLTASCNDVSPEETTDSSVSALSGAVFTGLEDGSSVNSNLYDAKEDVYLDGGPPAGAPSNAAALPAGYYYFQVTDPSGHTLLSEDEIGCRRFRVSDDGVVDAYAPQNCTTPLHLTGIDEDHDELGAITIQLMPYADTPNNGGEYKMWVTSVDDYEEGEGKHGFLPSDSKTDNFKVRETEEEPPRCGDGDLDPYEECDDGNTMDGDGCSSDCRCESEPPRCGDGDLDPYEECDDGNTMDGDGCSSDCTTERRSRCGDGEVEYEYEECDDGNTMDGDGCSARCECEYLNNGGSECNLPQ